MDLEDVLACLGRVADLIFVLTTSDVLIVVATVACSWVDFAPLLYCLSDKSLRPWLSDFAGIVLVVYSSDSQTSQKTLKSVGEKISYLLHTK